MATAREVRAAVWAGLAEQMAGRRKAALSVASAYTKVEKALSGGWGGPRMTEGGTCLGSRALAISA